jgi:hypothetical protein
VTDVALKINYPPYLLTLDFRHEVDFARASATVTDESVQIVVPKVSPSVDLRASVGHCFTFYSYI